MPIIWKEEFINNYLKFCHQFSTDQLENYWAIRRCDVDKIRKILAQPKGLQQIFMEDAQHQGIWNFLHDLEDNKRRQEIYDMLFAAIQAVDASERFFFS